MTTPYLTLEASTSDGRPVECYRFSQGAAVTALTNAEAPITLAGTTYQPAIISRSSIGASEERRTRTIEVYLPEDHPFVAPLVAGLTPIPIALALFGTHRSDLSSAGLIWQGQIASAAFGDRQATLQGVPLQSALDERLPRHLIGRACMWMLYRAGCGVPESSFTSPATVVAVTPGSPGPAVQVAGAPFLGAGAQHYQYGTLRLGDARAMIAAQAGDQLTLLSPLPGLVPGAPISLVAGCDRTAATCASRFGNLTRFGGFPALPTRNPFDRLDA